MSGMSARARVHVGEIDASPRASPPPTAARAPRTRPSGRRRTNRPGRPFRPRCPRDSTARRTRRARRRCRGSSRSQRLTLAGPGTSSRLGHAPRAGGAAQTKMICAPSSAAIVAVRLCHASSQTSMAARPHGVSNARTSRPRSTKRSSSNRPYVGRKTFRWTCADLRVARAERHVHRSCCTACCSRSRRSRATTSSGLGAT